MAIDNPQALKFSNDNVRPMANLYAQLYYRAKFFLDTWEAQGFDTLIPAGGGSVEDGAGVQNGMPPITAAHVRGLQGNLQLLVNDLENNSNQKLNGLLQIATAPEPNQ